jgi:hypothetical protein
MPDTVTVAAADLQRLTNVFGIATRAFGGNLGQIPGFGDALEACARLEIALSQAQMPEDPVPGGKVLAIALHEQLLEYESADFERHEAFELVKMHAAIVLNVGALRSMHG